MPDPALFQPAPRPAGIRADDRSAADTAGDHGETWIASEYARGPWDPRHCHGGPVSALLARACERAPSGDVDWLITRLTIDLTRPVPVGVPLVLTTHVERPGRKVSMVAASLSDDGTEVAKVRALRIRRRSFVLPHHPLAVSELRGTPGEGRHERVAWAVEGAPEQQPLAFHSHGAEHRIVTGSWNDPGPIQLWIRLSVALVAGETPTGVQRAAAAADFGNGVSSGLDYDEFLYINPDLTVHLAREPVGEWIGMATHSVYGTPTESSGAGFAESALHDGLGRLGRSVQSLLVDPR